jgi:hypothetical protein
LAWCLACRLRRQTCSDLGFFLATDANRSEVSGVAQRSRRCLVSLPHQPTYHSPSPRPRLQTCHLRPPLQMCRLRPPLQMRRPRPRLQRCRPHPRSPNQFHPQSLVRLQGRRCRAAVLSRSRASLNTTCSPPLRCPLKESGKATGTKSSCSFGRLMKKPRRTRREPREPRSEPSSNSSIDQGTGTAVFSFPM